jgi:hypothetical protein
MSIEAAKERVRGGRSAEVAYGGLTAQLACQHRHRITPLRYTHMCD